VKSRLGYVLAAICLTAGTSIAIWLAMSAYARLQNALTRVVVPGAIVLTLDEAGRYTIYHEPESVVDGQLYAAPNIAGLHVAVTGEDGKAVAVATPWISGSYAIGSHSGKSVWAFEIPAPGRYRLTAGYSAGQTEPQTVLAVGRDFFGRALATIFGAIGSVFAGFVAALVLALTTYLRRRRLRQTTGPATRRF
jgi:hypothetical protein